MTTSPVPVPAVGNGWLAVDKPGGMSIHNDPGADVVSLLTGFLHSNFQKNPGGAAPRLESMTRFRILESSIHDTLMP